jgi:hypothetical protein
MEESPKDKVSNIEYHAFPGDFVDVFEKVPRLSPKRDIDLSINMMPEATLMSKNPERMSTPELK